MDFFFSEHCRESVEMKGGKAARRSSNFKYLVKVDFYKNSPRGGNFRVTNHIEIKSIFHIKGDKYQETCDQGDPKCEDHAEPAITLQKSAAIRTLLSLMLLFLLS